MHPADGAMFPIGKQNLSLLEIADYWSREIRPPASRKELLRLLESAWWLGEIHGDSILTRLELLKRMFQSMGDRTDLGIVFITGEGQEQSTIERLRDGSVVVDVRPQIPVPSTDTGSWDEDNCESAFLALAPRSCCLRCSSYDRRSDACRRHDLIGGEGTHSKR